MHTTIPAARDIAPRDLFSALRDQWKRDTLVESSMTAIVLHPAYQRIIGMGDRALPFLFAELKREPAQWFWALEAITGEDVASDDLPFAERVTRWLEWGRQHGFG